MYCDQSIVRHGRRGSTTGLREVVETPDDAVKGQEDAVVVVTVNPIDPNTVN